MPNIKQTESGKAWEYGLAQRCADIFDVPLTENTSKVVLDEGWQVSFRIHNARSMIEPSLKFDINLKGHPDKLTSHSIPYD